MSQPKKGARSGFANRSRKARNNMTIPDILTPNTEALFNAMIYNALVCGACVILNTNKAISAVKVKLLLDDDSEEEWLNTPEEAQDHLYQLGQMLHETAVERGYLQAPVRESKE